MFQTSLELKENYRELLEIALENNVESMNMFSSHEDFPQQVLNIIFSPECKKKMLMDASKLAVETFVHVHPQENIYIKKQQKIHITKIMFELDEKYQNSIVLLYFTVFCTRNELNELWPVMAEKVNEGETQAKSIAFICDVLLKSVHDGTNPLPLIITDESNEELEQNTTEFDSKTQIRNILQKLENFILNTTNLDLRILYFESFCTIFSFGLKMCVICCDTISLFMNESIRLGIGIKNEFNTLWECFKREDSEQIWVYILNFCKNYSFSKSQKTTSLTNLHEKLIFIISELLPKVLQKNRCEKYKDFQKTFIFCTIRDLFKLVFGPTRPKSFKFSRFVNSNRFYSSPTIILLIIEIGVDYDAKYFLDFILKKLHEADGSFFDNLYKAFILLLKSSPTTVLKKQQKCIRTLMHILSNEKLKKGLKMLNALFEFLPNIIIYNPKQLSDKLKPPMYSKDSRTFLEVTKAIGYMGSVSKSFFSFHIKTLAPLLMAKLSFDSNDKKSLELAIAYAKSLSKMILIMEKDDLEKHFKELDSFIMKYIKDLSLCSLLGFDLLNSLILVFPEKFEAHVSFFLDIISYWFHEKQDCDSQKICALELLATIAHNFHLGYVFLNKVDEFVVPLNYSLGQIFPPIKRLVSRVLREFNDEIFEKVFVLMMNYCKADSNELKTSLEFADFLNECINDKSTQGILGKMENLMEKVRNSFYYTLDNNQCGNFKTKQKLLREKAESCFKIKNE